MKKTYIIIILLALVAFYFLSYKRRSVEVVKPEVNTAVEAVYASGTVEAVKMYPLFSRVTASIKEFHVKEGQVIKKDDLLVSLIDEQTLRNYEQFLSQEQFALKEFSRQKKLINSTSKNKFEKAKSDYYSAKAATLKAKSMLDELTIKAKSSGRIIQLDGQIGQTISANEAILWVTEGEELRITAEVDEEDISKVKTSQKVLISSDAFENKIFEGNLKSITPKGNPETRSYRVRIAIKKNTPLKIGMTTENNIIISEEKDSLLIPTNLISDNSESSSVWIVKNKKLEKRNIKIGIKNIERAQVLSGLDKDDLIVSGAENQEAKEFEEGQKVTIRNSF